MRPNPASMAAYGLAPTLEATTSPWWNSAMVGMPLDGVATGDLGVGVDVDLDDLHRGAVRSGELLELGGHHAARAAPGRPEVDDDGDVGLEHFGGEGGGVIGGGEAGDWSSSHRLGFGFGCQDAEQRLGPNSNSWRRATGVSGDPCSP